MDHGPSPELKAQSERIIEALGGRVNPGLPRLDRTEPRGSAEVADRALVLNAMLQIYFGAPQSLIASWIAANHVEASLSRRDRRILDAKPGELAKQERTNLFWYIEALWAMAWAGQRIEGLPVDKPVGNNLASLVPRLQKNEDAGGFRRRFVLRPFNQIYPMLDLYYRAHWYARDGRLRGFSTAPFDLDVIMERRKALEWISDRTLSDWDDATDST